MGNLHRCEMCGKEVPRLIEIEIEGARLFVCNSCAVHGKKVIEKKTSSRKRRVVNTAKTSTGAKPIKTTPIHNVQKPARQYTRKYNSDGSEMLAEDYGERLRLARQKLKLTQKEVAKKTKISATIIQSFELGKLKPTDEQIKVLEKFYGIKLTEKIINYGVSDTKHTPTYQTLGDIVVIKKKDE